MMNSEWIEFYLGMAEYVSRKSKDPSTKCGCVIVRPDKTVCSIGYNGFPAAIEDAPALLENRDEKYKFVVHAEDNAFKNARDTSFEGYCLFTHPFMPCPHCALDMVSNGISTVHTRPTPEDKLDRWKDAFEKSKDILYRGGVELVIVEDKTENGDESLDFAQRVRDRFARSNTHSTNKKSPPGMVPIVTYTPGKPVSAELPEFDMETYHNSVKDFLDGWYKMIHLDRYRHSESTNYIHNLIPVSNNMRDPDRMKFTSTDLLLMQKAKDELDRVLSYVSDLYLGRPIDGQLTERVVNEMNDKLSLSQVAPSTTGNGSISLEVVFKGYTKEQTDWFMNNL